MIIKRNKAQQLQQQKAHAVEEQAEKRQRASHAQNAKRTKQRQQNVQQQKNTNDTNGSDAESIDSPTLNDEQLAPPADYSSSSIAEGTVEDRRNSNRSRTYRRLEDRNLISQAEEEAQQIRKTAQEEGFQEGLSQATHEVAELQRGLTELLTGRSEVLQSLVNDLGPLAVEIAEHIIKTEVACDEELVKMIVQDTLKRVERNTKSILIKVHPDDVTLVKANLKEDPPSHLKAELIVLDDLSVDPGSCILETSSGLIDASFSTRIELLRKLFGNYNAEKEAVKLSVSPPEPTPAKPTESTENAPHPLTPEPAAPEDTDIQATETPAPNNPNENPPPPT